jgi:hypothetical protein
MGQLLLVEEVAAVELKAVPVVMVVVEVIRHQHMSHNLVRHMTHNALRGLVTAQIVI